MHTHARRTDADRMTNSPVHSGHLRPARSSALALVILALVSVTGCSKAASAPGSEAPFPSAMSSSAERSGAPPTRSVAITSASTGPSALPTSSLKGGGPVAWAALDRIWRSNFSARIEIHSTTSTTTGSNAAKVVGTQTGVINGQDLDLTLFASDGRTEHRSRIVSLGDTVYASADGGPWQVFKRASVHLQVDQLLREARRTTFGDQLADVGEDTVDGQVARHLTLTAPFTFDDPALGPLSFDAYDLWATPDGTPVLRKETIHGSTGSTVWSGTSETHYREVGAMTAIVAPALPRPTTSPRPSVR